MRRLTRISIWIVAAILVLIGGVYLAFQVSPWPSALLIRQAFDKSGTQTNAALAPLVGPGVSARLAVRYAADDSDALMDVFAPTDAIGAPRPAIVWIHGGAFLAGSRADLTNYLKIVAAKGYVAFAVDYTLAPEAKFPTPLRQVDAALGYVVANASAFGVDPQRIFLAGDSAGAQLAAQLALVVTDTAYGRTIGIAPSIGRERLRGVLLYCGPLDPTELNYQGAFAGFMRTVLWSYIGTRDPADPRVGAMAVTPHLVSNYPPVFISVGNADPLAPQSVTFAATARQRGVKVDDLFFPADYKPALQHEYQFLLDREAGRLALQRSLDFLAAASR